MTPTHSTASAGITRPRSAGTDIALVAVFAALIAAFAMMPPVPVGPLGVPIVVPNPQCEVTSLYAWKELPDT